MRKGCELFVEKFLPKIKANIAQTLVKRYGLTQHEVAQVLDISQSNVSKSLSQKTPNYGKYQEFNKIIKKILDKQDFSLEMCSLCNKLKIGCNRNNSL